MVDVECPVEECDFSGPIRSVKSHITASKQGDHDGRHGMDFSEELRERAEQAADAVRRRVGTASGGDGLPPIDADETGAAEDATDDGAGPVEDATDDGARSAEDATGDPSSTLGVPIPVSSMTLLVGVALVVGGLLFYSYTTDATADDTTDDEAAADEQAEDDWNGVGGLQGADGGVVE